MNESSRTVVTCAAIFLCVALVVGCASLCCCGAGTVAGAAGIYWLVEEALFTPEPPPTQADFVPAPPAGSPQDVLARELAERIGSTPTTDTDYWLLHGLLESESGEPANREPVQPPPDYQEGDVHTFWMGDEQEQRYWQIDAELQIETDHAYFYVDAGTPFEEQELRRAADLFESQIYVTNHLYFGSEWSPGIDNDPHITILVTDDMPFGIAGYFSSSDEYPTAVQPRSNEREMIYVTASYLGSLDNFGSLLSHEFQHMIHWNQDTSEATWINEGLSLLAEEVNGYQGVLGGWMYWPNPDVQLTNWAEDFDDRTRNYAASKLFVSYLSEHYGGYEILRQLAADDADGSDGIDRVLQANGTDADFVSVFADWTVANLLGDASIGDGRYDYALRGSTPRTSATLDEQSRETLGWVRQFGVDYVEIDPRAGRNVTFEGSGLVGVTSAAPHGGDSCWWSNRRNMLSSSLTRRVDLEDVAAATLRFWTWYDIEADFDYGYVMVSTDEGRTWETLPGTHTTASDPNDASFGHGYTGKSHGWLEEQVDLSAYAGQDVLLRFWYLTDPGLNQPGWLIDDVSIPEIGLADDAEEGDGGWTVDGFVRSSNALHQEFLVHLVEVGRETTVRRLQPDAANRVEADLEAGTRRAVLVISGATRWTSEPAPYRVVVE